MCFDLFQESISFMFKFKMKVIVYEIVYLFFSNRILFEIIMVSRSVFISFILLC